MNLQWCFVLLSGSLCFFTIFVNICSASTASTNASLYISPESAVAEVGSSVVFNCSVDGLLPPKTSIKWYKEWCKEGSGALTKNSTKLLADGTLQLVLSNVQLADAEPGYYTCCVVLEDGRCDHEFETHVRLRVGFPPEPVRDLTCVAHSTYFGNCLWNDSRRDSNLETRCTLQRKFQNNDKDWAAVKCIESYSPPSDIMADHRCSFKGDDKGYVYRVVSVNSLGENTTKQSAAFNVHHNAFPYDPPNVTKVTPLSTSSVRVRWDIVEGFSERNIKYKLRYNTNFNADWILFPKEVSGTKKPTPWALLEDLHPPYANICVQVSATEINQYPTTWGLWSESQCSRLLEEIPVVGPKIHRLEPEENMEDEINLKDVTLFWEHIPEIKRNGKIRGYTITVIGFLDTLYENRQTFYVSENATEYHLKGLNRTYTYDVQLTAKNSMGISPVTNVTISPNPYHLAELSGMSRGFFISLLVMLILTAFMLLSFILYCSWKKVKKEKFPDPKIPDIVMQSNAYKKKDFMRFHTSEPEHFDAVNLEYDPLLVSHDFSDEQNTAQTAAAIILAGAGQTQQYRTRSIGSGGSYWSNKDDDRTKDNDDGIIYKRMTPQGLSPIDKDSPRHQWGDNIIGEPTKDNDDDGIIYKRMTPQGLSPLYKDSPRNQWDIINVINESTDTSIDTYVKQSAASGAPSTACNSRTSSLHRTANHSRSRSQDITGHYLPVSTPSSSSSGAGSQESGINNYTQQSQTTPFSPQSCDETTQQITPQGLSPIDKKCPGNLWNRLVETTIAGSRTDSGRDTDSCDDSIGSYTKQSANHSCNSSATSSPYQSNNSSPIKTRRRTHLDDLCIDDAIKSIQSHEKLPEASDTQTSDVSNYVKAGTNSNELRANSSEISRDMRASSSDDVSNYVQAAVQGRDINITENPLTTAHSEGQLQINNYVTCAQNSSMRNRQGSVDSNDSLNMPSCCISSENGNRLENRDSRSSSCSSMEAPYVVHGSANGAELCADKFLVSNVANNTVVLDIEPSPKISPESPQKSIVDIHSNVSNTLNNQSGYISHPGSTIITNNNHQNEPAIDIYVTNSSLPASNELLFPDAKTPQTLPNVTKDFNSNLIPTNSLPKLPCNDGYTPVSAVMHACKQQPMPSLVTPEAAPYIPLPSSLPIPLPSPLPNGSDDGYSSHGNNSPPDTPNILTDDKNVQEDKLTIVCIQSQPTQDISGGYTCFSAL